MSFNNLKEKQKEQIDLNDRVFRWVAKRFGQSIGGRIVCWSANEPTFGRAQHHVDRGKIYVRISSSHYGVPAGFEELWAACVAELGNISQKEKYDSILKFAVLNNVETSTFTKSILRLEYKSQRATRAFYFSYWQPWAKAHNFNTNPELWWVDCPKSFDTWSNTKTAENLRGYYSTCYDKIIKTATLDDKQSMRRIREELRLKLQEDGSVQ